MLRTSPVLQTLESELILVGKVTAIEPVVLKLAPFPGGKKVNYMVAVVKVEKTLLGVKGLTHIRVGFIPSATTDENDEEELCQGFQCDERSNLASQNLREGQEACFFLKKHPQADFYTFPQGGGPLHKRPRYFDEDLQQVEKALKVLQEPVAALRAKDSIDRQFAACLLIHRYRVQPQAPSGSTMKTEPIAAEESKLILTALSEMLWGDVCLDRQNTLSIQTTFPALGVTDKEGWRPPVIQNGDNYNFVMGDAVKKWLTENKSKYRIQRYVNANKPTIR